MSTIVVKKEYIIPVMPLFILFLILKLTNVITWSWWWVCAPLWMPFVLYIGLIILLGIVTLLVSLFDGKRRF
jgi:hypothetical protein